MSKARKQSLTRAVSRAMKGREQLPGVNYKPFSKGEKEPTKKVLIAKKVRKPRVHLEFMETFGKLYIYVRASCGHNRLRNTKDKRPYYYLRGSV